MTIAELNRLVAHYSTDPDNEPAMALATYYAKVRDSMMTAPADDATDDAGREVA
jgi:hypothetical protein